MGQETFAGVASLMHKEWVCE